MRYFHLSGRKFTGQALAPDARIGRKGVVMTSISIEEAKALPLLMDVKQAASILGCSTRTVARMCDGGRLKHCRVGNMYRINRDALLEYAGLSDHAKAVR